MGGEWGIPLLQDQRPEDSGRCGACNPNSARQAIDAQPEIGALLPCKVVVRTDVAGAVYVEFMDPGAILKLTEHLDAAKLFGEVLPACPGAGYAARSATAW